MGANHRMAVAVFFVATAIAGLAAHGWGELKPESVEAVPHELSKDDDQAVRKIVTGFEHAWNAHDMDALASLFREDAEWVNKVGMHWRGRDEIMVAHTAFHHTIFKNHKYRTDTVETRAIVPGVAVAVATETFDGFMTPDGQVVPKARNRLSYVVVKGMDGWKIAHGQNSVVDEGAAKHDPVMRNRR